MPGQAAAPPLAPAGKQTGPQGTFAALAVPNFRRFVAGQSLSLISTWVETVAQALLVLRLTHSGTVLGLTTAARYAPILLLSPYAGLVVDRHSKRLNSTTVNVARVIGPAIAAVLVSTIDIGWCFVVNAVSLSFVIASRRMFRRSPGRC
jgi:MFS family permease